MGSTADRVRPRHLHTSRLPALPPVNSRGLEDSLCLCTAPPTLSPAQGMGLCRSDLQLHGGDSLPYLHRRQRERVDGTAWFRRYRLCFLGVTPADAPPCTRESS